MSAIVPSLNRWQQDRYEWMHVFHKAAKPFVLPANGEVEIPSERFIYNYKEGVIQLFIAVFDNPACGFRWQAYPALDLENFFTVANALLVTVPPDPLVYAITPPDSPFYAIRVESPWKWEQWLKMSLINTDSEDHYCIGYTYLLMVTNRKLAEPEKLTAEKMLLYSQFYPEIVVDLKKKMRKQAEAEMETLGISLKT